jgi:nucleoid-associated protein YgaU
VSLQKAYFVNLEPKSTIAPLEVQFNPTDLSFSKTAQFAEIVIPGLDQPVLQFIRGGTETLTVELFFDTTDEGMSTGAKSVTELTDKFYQLVKQNPDTHAPPRCRFSWGAAGTESKPAQGEALGPLGQGKEVSKAPFWFTGIVESVDRKFLLFSPDGVPLRARLTVRMREYKTVEQMVAGLKSADHTKVRVLKRRERLDQISATEYDTPAEWRRIAEENEIDDPRRVPPGTILRVPPMTVESATRRSS